MRKCQSNLAAAMSLIALGACAHGGAAPLQRTDDRASEAAMKTLRTKGPAGLADAVVEHRLVSSSERRRLDSVWFATRPRSSGHPGLCEATIAVVSHHPARGEEPIHIQLEYKIVGDLDPATGPWTEADDAALDARCAKAGPVLTDISSGAFFDVTPGPAWLSARTLQKAIRQAADPKLQVTCDAGEGSEPGDCNDPREALARLPLENLTWIWEGPCFRGPPGRCVEGHWTRSYVHPYLREWIVQVRTKEGATELEIESVLGSSGDTIRISPRAGKARSGRSPEL